MGQISRRRRLSTLFGAIVASAVFYFCSYHTSYKSEYALGVIFGLLAGTCAGTVFFTVVSESRQCGGCCDI
ncbi:hypothetical protein TrRE_jg8765 [Triparma retinervis]|uniref:Uncharacterized protein n=1 Tax=Triparma retinervis TaxID=2557542 RepID=A0A9W6Z3A4_9STRA|nr:hypothetical protein TrRE_jg8765 [Triparma retinervis]